MTITVENQLREVGTLTQKLLDLMAVDNPTPSQSKRMAELGSAINAIKAGASLEQVKAWQTDELRKAAGLSRLPDRPRTSSLGEEIEAAWRKWAATGECRETFIPHPRDIKATETRANEAGSQSIVSSTFPAGTAFVPQGFSERAYAAMKTYDAIFDEQFSNVVETGTGSNMPFPVWDDTSNDSVQVGEAVQSNEVDVASFGTTQLSAYSFRSKVVGVSLELLQDSQFPIGSILERVFAARHARGVGKALVTGSGTNAPTGLLTGVVASGVSPTIVNGASVNDGGADSESNSISTQDVNKLYHSLDKIYRPGASFYCTDNTVKFLEGLLDKNGRPIVSFRKGLTGYDNDIPCMMGKPIAVCPSMPEISNGTSPIIFGNGQTYFIFRKIPSSMYVRRFWQNPTLATFGLVGFESWLRCDSGIIAPNAAHAPFQFIQCHS